MLLTLDANEYIFAFGPEPKASCGLLLDAIAKGPPCAIRICRPTVAEVRKHLAPQDFRDFLAYLQSLEVAIDEEEFVPYEFGANFLARGLKPGDAFLAGYAEWVGAQCLISENRKDLVDHPELFPFQVLTAEAFFAKYFR